MVDFNDALRDQMITHLDRHNQQGRIVHPLDGRRHAAVAIVVVDAHHSEAVLTGSPIPLSLARIRSMAFPGIFPVSMARSRALALVPHFCCAADRLGSRTTRTNGRCLEVALILAKPQK